MRAGLVQMTSSDDPSENAETARALVREAAQGGATFVLTPEVTNCVSTSKSRQEQVLVAEARDETLAALREEASALGIWVLIGSLALAEVAPDGRFVNRSILIGPDGAIRARYDKIHMFDVTISEAETHRESDGYRPGEVAVLSDVDGVPVGLTICYDLRFPHLHRHLAQAGAKILTVPSAFTPETGRAHWEVLLRARAIECGCFVLAPAQTGSHELVAGRSRTTYGHSLAVDPWGKVLADGGDLPGVTLVDLDLASVDDVRSRLPALAHDRDYRPAL